MKARKEYTVPVINVLNIETEHVLLAGSGPDTSLKDQNGTDLSDKPEIGEGSGGGPGAKPYTPWDDESEW